MPLQAVVAHCLPRNQKLQSLMEVKQPGSSSHILRAHATKKNLKGYGTVLNETASFGLLDKRAGDICCTVDCELVWKV